MREGQKVSLTVYSQSAHGFVAMPFRTADKIEAEEEIIAVVKKWSFETSS